MDNTAQVCKASRARLYGYFVVNPNTDDAWLHFYNAAAAGVTVGTTTPMLSLWVPGEGGIDEMFSIPVEFSTALTYAASTTVTGGTDPTAGLVANLYYR